MWSFKRNPVSSSLLSVLLIFLLISFANIISSCEDNPDEDDGIPLPVTQTDTVTILYTNDEHGWMERDDDLGGAAEMMALWQQREGLTTTSPHLILSGGDMWTGAAISTWFDGESMVEVMNAMGYKAAAMGNHEVDFGMEQLQALSEEMDFPILAANLTEDATGDHPGYVDPFTVVSVGNREIGIIGLGNFYMPELVFPQYCEGVTYGDYETALETYTPEVFAAGADVVIVIAHISGSELSTLSSTAEELGILLIGGGHTNEFIATVNNGVALMMANTALNYYGKAQIVFDDDGTASVLTPELVANNQSGSNATIAGIVASWSVQLDDILGTVIGYLDAEIVARSHTMSNMITDSWLESALIADLSIINTGGMRAAIPAGEITLETIVSVLPFDNYIYRVTLTGAQLTQYLDYCDGYIRYGGLTAIDGYKFTDGSSIDPSGTYQMLTTDYYYFASQGEAVDLTVMDPDPYDSGWNFRDPVIDWIEGLGTTVDDPLDNYLDPTPRQ